MTMVSSPVGSICGASSMRSAPATVLDRHAPRDAEQPAREARVVTEAVDAAECEQESLLSRIQRIVQVPRRAQADREHHVLVALVQRVEGLVPAIRALLASEHEREIRIGCRGGVHQSARGS